MKTSSNGLALIKQFEGLRTQAYICPAGVLTIGYGSTGAHVKRGMVITEAQATALLAQDVVRFEKAVNGLGVALTQNQFDALVSFAFNVGEKALRDSTLAKKLKAGDYKRAAAQFGAWVKGGGKTLPGLVRRRAAEAALFVR
ncbi:lysozyme [Sphingomonas sp. Leaf257]|jgi:lysozyme|uniref:lysozyme n=1 Tax=Sphingomonas sp. Leaf257 TaxID=1736309 RepID=UPI0006F3C493|nr:lysozyme [Sphingomonas sp. Leaf257]KQO56460.1 hypothetical protein ASF14_18205 [Sphingomonas sp. Leaf257]